MAAGAVRTSWLPWVICSRSSSRRRGGGGMGVGAAPRPPRTTRPPHNATGTEHSIKGRVSLSETTRAYGYFKNTVARRVSQMEEGGGERRGRVAPNPRMNSPLAPRIPSQRVRRPLGPLPVFSSGNAGDTFLDYETETR
jgi:hypothetical protein